MSVSLSRSENRHWGCVKDRVDSEPRSRKRPISSSVVNLLAMLCFLGCSENKNNSSAPGNPSAKSTQSQQNHPASDATDRKSGSSISIECEVPGLSPLEVENLVTSHIEIALDGSSGIKRLDSVSRTGQAVFWAWFDPGVNLSLMLAKTS